MKERSCKSSDISALKTRLYRARDLGNAGVRHISETVSEIEGAIDGVSKPEGLRKLKTIPVDELNARKAGIRINLLKDAGYTDMYSICTTSQQTLASVYGIGDIMAAKAKEIGNAVAAEVCNSVKLKLSTDHKTEEYSRLVVSVAEHMRAKEIFPKSEQVLSMLPPNMDAELDKLKCAKSGLKWFFAKDAKKNEANDAFARLKASADAIDASNLLIQINGTGLVNGSLSGTASSAVSSLANAPVGAAGAGVPASAVLGLRPITIAEAWADFAERPVEYYNVLEEIAPDRFDSSEDGYGLSDEIRESVEKTPVDLTGLKCTLRGYQIWGVKYILRQKRVLLGDEMGLGKTIQALAAMVSLRNGVPDDSAAAPSVEPAPSQTAVPAATTAAIPIVMPEQAPAPAPVAATPAPAPAAPAPLVEAAQVVAPAPAPTETAVAPLSTPAPAPAEEKKEPKITHFLVICPASVIVNWCREVEAKSDLKSYNMHDSQRTSAFAAWVENGGVAVTNFESLENRFSVPEDFPIDMIIVDEAHYIKNIAAKRSQNVLRLCDHTDRILFMTGTPLENRVEEMVGLMDHLQHEVAQDAKSVSVTAYADDFKRKISPVYYRRRRNDVLSELPELTDIKEWCDMTPEDERAYEDDVLTGSFMDVRRVSWRNEDYMNTSAKVQRLKEIVEDASEDARKVLVFSFFLDTLEKVKTVFGDACVGVINGAVPVEERQNIVDAFEAAPAGSVLAAQIQSGGTGLNIQSASVVVLCEPQYKPSTENQAIGRAHRMGQTRDVLVHRLLCPNTVDEKMLDLVEAKQAEFDTFADESSAAERDASLEQAGVDVNEGVIVGQVAAEGVQGAQGTSGTGSQSEQAQPVQGAQIPAASASSASSGTEKGELDAASLNKIFADEKARILAKREREGQQLQAAAVPQPQASVQSAAAPQPAPEPQPQQPAPEPQPQQPAPEPQPQQPASVPSVPVSQPAPAQPAPAPLTREGKPISASVIFCRMCGEKNPMGSKFCNQCGCNLQ